MSGFLKNRKMWLAMAYILTIAVLIVFRFYLVVLVFVLCGCVLVSMYIIDEKVRLPLRELTSKRNIKTIETLIIGDYCSRKVLSSLYDLDKSLIVMAPGRSVKASLLILQHLASRLDGKNVCIVAPKYTTETITPLDAPFFSELTKFDLGVSNSIKQRFIYLMKHPLILLTALTTAIKNPSLVQPFNSDILTYCNRKGFNLTCLQK